MIRLSSRIACLLAVGLAVVQRLLVGFWPADDAFIAFRFARNLAERGELAFNPGDPVFGCTTLIYPMVLAALNALGVPIVTAAGALTPAADALVGLMLVRLASRLYGQPALGLIGFALWLIHPIIGLNAVSGMETSIFVALLLGVVEVCGAGRFGWGLVMLGALVWTRPDGLAAAPIWAYAWWKAGRPRLERAPTLLAVALVAGYAALTLELYGSLVPTSASAKLSFAPGSATGVLLMALSFPSAMAGLLSNFHWFASIHILVLFGALDWLRHRRSAVRGEALLMGLAAVHAALFILPGRSIATLFPWYYVPALTLVMLPALHRIRLRLQEAREGRGGGFGPPVWLLAAGALSGAAAHLLLMVREGALLEMLAPWLSPVLTSSPARIDRVLLAIRVNTGLLALFGIVLFMGRRWIVSSSRPGRMLTVGFILSLMVASILPLVLNRQGLVDRYRRREAVYLALGSWVTGHLPRGELIAAREIGALGWSAPGHRIHDEFGLVTRGAGGVPRARWVPRLRPALLVNVSGHERRLRPGMELPGYFHVLTRHNLVFVREDLRPVWEADPPPLGE